MALITPQFGIPTSLVFTPRDYAKDMAARQQADKTAVQNLFKFGTQVYDYLQSRKQAKEMDKLGSSQADNLYLEMDDMDRLAKLKQELAELKGGV